MKAVGTRVHEGRCFVDMRECASSGAREGVEEKGSVRERTCVRHVRGARALKVVHSPGGERV